MLIGSDARFLLYVSIHVVRMLEWKGWFWVVGHYLYISKGVYILLKMEPRGFWVVLLVLEGPVRMLNPWGVGTKEGAAAY